MPAKRPTKADRMLVAAGIRRQAKQMREIAWSNRQTAKHETRPDVAEFFAKFAGQQETKAARFERVANWMVSDGE